MGRLLADRRVLMVAVVLGYLAVLGGQYATSASAATPQEVIDEWRQVFPNEPYVCWQKGSPWDGLDRLQSPPAGVTVLQTIRVDMGKSEYESTSFVLTNLSDKPMEFKITSAPSIPKGISPTLRKGVWITAQDGAKVNDALSLIDNNQVTIPSGESLEIWITLQSDNAAAGKYEQTINVSPKGLESREVNIATEVHDVSLPKRMPLSTYYWSYIAPGWSTPELAAAKLADLKSHYVNSPTIHPFVLPRFEFDDNGQLITDYSTFDDGMAMYEGGLAPEAYVFEMLSTVYFEPTDKPDYPGAKNRPKFLSPKWKTGFRIWLTGWVAHMKSRGMGYDRYFVHPYDERLDDNVLAVVKLIKETDPQIRVVINASGSAEEVNNIAPYVDVWMPLLNHWLPIGGVTGAMSQTVSLNPNVKYTFSFYGRDGTSVNYWSMEFDGSTPRTANVLGTTDWTQQTYSFTTAADTTKVTMNFCPMVGNGSIFVDDVVLVGSGPNLVANGDMELGTTSPPYGWTTNSATTAVNTTDPHSGSKSVEVTSIPKGSNPGRDAIQAVVSSKPSSLWTYANPQGVLPSKANPYKYYRLAIWKAWDEGMTGFGYWIYCNREAWNYAEKAKPGWAVVYNATLADTPPEVSKKELIVVGKRWEATREGVEDYAYLYLLQEAIGKASPEAAAKAKKLLDFWTEEVVKKENDPLLADTAKKHIMEELAIMSRK